MRHYWKGCLLLILGITPFLLFFLWLQPLLKSDLYERVLSGIEERSDPLPAEFANLLPLYPKTRGLHVYQFRESTSISATTKDEPEKVLQFYENELLKLGWQRNPDDDAGKGGVSFILGQYELYVHGFPDAMLPPDTSIIISITDETKKFHPSKESNENAKAILSSVAETYHNCSSYRDVGSEVTHFLNNGRSGDYTSTESFKTAYIRPDRFRMEIVEDDDQSFGAARVIHSDESGVREWRNTFSSGITLYKTLSESLADRHGVPMLLTNKEDCWPLNLQELEAPVEEVLNRVQTYRIHGKDNNGEETVVWIDKDQLVLRQVKEETYFDDFRTESVTTWEPQINTSIPDNDLEFRPFGRIPISLVQKTVSAIYLWRSTPILVKILALSCASLILAGLLHILKTYRRKRSCV